MIWAGDLAAMCQVGLAGYAVGGAFAGLAYFDLPYHLMAIIILCKSIVRHAEIEGAVRIPAARDYPDEPRSQVVAHAV